MSLDPVTLAVFVGAMRAACDEMGAVLIRSAHSPNIKERHDCSTALFDAQGELVMQAEHIPVHLGSMPDAVAAILGSEQSPGDLWILNDPYPGGTHLPDITLIAPIFMPGGLIGFAASRAHHADVGGPTPGGMPAHSTRLEDEGVVISPTRVGDRDAGGDRRPHARHQGTARRSARAAGRARGRRSPRRRALRTPRRGDDPRGNGGDSQLLRTANPRADRRAAGRALRRPRRPGGRRRRFARRVPEGGCRGRKRHPAAGLLPQRRPARRQPQLSACRDEVGGVLCGTRPARSRCATLGGRPPPDRRRRAGGLHPERPVPRCRGRRQRRDVKPRRRPGDVGAGRRAQRACPGPGDDEQRHARRRGLHLLRDDWRRPGRLPRGRRARARSTSPCPTRSTPRSKRWRRSCPCGSASSAYGRGAAAQDATTAARGSCARSRRWRRCVSR